MLNEPSVSIGPSNSIAFSGLIEHDSAGGQWLPVSEENLPFDRVQLHLANGIGIAAASESEHCQPESGRKTERGTRTIRRDPLSQFHSNLPIHEYSLK